MISILWLWYVYHGYRLFLELVVRFASRQDCPGEALPHITVLLTVYNEAELIQERIFNILDCEYPWDRMQLLIASDGSDDGTQEIVRSISDSRIELVDMTVRVGKSAAQNAALQHAVGDVVIFTDAGTRFSREFLRQIVKPFSCQDVGAVDGHLLFVSSGTGQIDSSQGYYWRYELMIRSLESRLGMLAVSSGACLAVRRALLRPLPPAIGEDCVVPLDVVVQGYRVVHQNGAVAHDCMESDTSREFKTRVRMTLRNWQGTLLYPALLNPFVRARYSIALWSHKLLRWLSPIPLITVVGSGIYLGVTGSSISVMANAVNLFLLGGGLVGWWGERTGRRLPVAGNIFAFWLANAGFFVGTFRALIGSRVVAYSR